jgi:hypothetical protein
MPNREILSERDDAARRSPDHRSGVRRTLQTLTAFFGVAAGAAAAEAPAPAPETDVPNAAAAATAPELPQGPVPPAVADALGKTTFLPPSTDDIRRHLGALRAAAERMAARIAVGPEPDHWRAYVRLDDLRRELQKPEGADLAVLAEIHARLAASHSPLFNEWFKEVEAELRRVLLLSRASNKPAVAGITRDTLDKLSRTIGAYERTLSPEHAAAITAMLGWLSDTGQAPDVVRAVRRHYGHPNLYLDMSGPYVVSGLTRPVAQSAQTTSSIMEATVSGNGTSNGILRAELIPSENNAQLMVVLRGQGSGSSVSAADRVQVTGVSVGAFEARELLTIDPDRILAAPAGATANTNGTITGIGASGRRIAQRVATRRVYEAKPQADAIASQQMAEQVSTTLHLMMTQTAADAEDLYRSRFRRPLERRQIFPAQTSVRTTRDALHVTALEAGETQLGAPSGPPDVPLEAAMIRAHESALNNIATTRFGGRTMDGEEFLDSLNRWMGGSPAQLKSDEEAQEWGMTFAEQDPITIAFPGQNEFSITMRAQSYTKEGRRFPGMNMTARYRIVQGEDGLKATRLGDLAIVPEGFDPAKGDRLSARQSMLRSLLIRRMGRMLTPEIKPAGLKLPGPWGERRLPLSQWGTSEGWMVMGWREPTEHDPKEPAKH